MFGMLDKFVRSGRGISRDKADRMAVGECSEGEKVLFRLRRDVNTRVNDAWAAKQQEATESRKQEAQEALWW